MSQPTITLESQADPARVPPLDPSLLKLSDTQADFLRAAITSDETELRRRIIAVQEEAYAKYPYPCIHQFHHVSLFATMNPVYSSVLEAGKASQDALFLDLGCCMGSDVRKLVYDGYPAERVLACDLRREYIDLGHALYRDAETCSIRFFTSDIFAYTPPTESPAAHPAELQLSEVLDLAQLQGALTYIYTGALFHLFDESTQYAIALRLAWLLRRAPGAVIFGRHAGLVEAGMIDDHLGRTRYGHSPTSWPLLWKRVFTEVEGADFAETRIAVRAFLHDHDYHVHTGQRRSMMVWSVKIL